MHKGIIDHVNRFSKILCKSYFVAALIAIVMKRKKPEELFFEINACT